MKGWRLVSLLSVLVCVACVSCGHDSPPVQEVSSSRPGDAGAGSRPGVGDANSMEHELGDDVWRVSGPGVTLRYDRGGVLFNRLADGSFEIVDLDGADVVTVVPGKEGVDSVMTGAAITVNGKAKALRLMKMMHHGVGRSWYMATDEGDGLWIIVL